MKPNMLISRLGCTSGICKLLQVCLLLTLGIVFTACSNQKRLSNTPDLTGSYDLVTVNGATLPATVDHDGAKLTVRSGTFTISADGICVSKMVFVPPSGKEATLERKATYTREGPSLTMKWERAGMTKGTVQGDTFTMNNEGMVFAYRK